MESRTNISEEMADSFIGQKSPEIKPKLNDTNPSLLNLSSEYSQKGLVKRIVSIQIKMAKILFLQII